MYGDIKYLINFQFFQKLSKTFNFVFKIKNSHRIVDTVKINIYNELLNVHINILYNIIINKNIYSYLQLIYK